MRPPVATHRPAGINVMTAMTPMIDVVFNLLIFFIVSISMNAPESLLPANLSASGSVPAAVAVTPADASPRVDIWLQIQVDEAGKTVVDMNGTLHTDRELLKSQLMLLGNAGPENPIILKIQPAVPLADLVDVYDTCQLAGFESVSFAASAPAP
ncbi:ExbD/TolR family protein [Planctomicrobium sp. SH664]|uniref:ExbD/TolR family protein n=1 Tax=Planctomicrobium sp. SH664 TaxID=3448125 RepID=UPI003F5C9E02